MLLLPFLGREGLTDPGESAFAESTREALERGDWLAPRLLGEPAPRQPILPLWLAGASFRAFGVNEFAARFPSAVAAALTLLAVYRLGWLIHGHRRAGLLSAVVLGTALHFVMLGRSAGPDMVATALISLTLLAFLEALENPARRIVPLLGAAAAGLAALARGPVGMAIPLLVLLAYLAVTGSLRHLPRLRPVGSVLVMAAVMAPWWIALARRQPDFWAALAERPALDPMLQADPAPQPALYFPVLLAIGFLPWFAFLPGSLARLVAGWRAADETGRRSRLALVWFLLPAVLFWLSSGRLTFTLLPALPAAALLVTGTLESWFEPPVAGRRLPGTAGMLLLVFLAGGAVVFAARPGAVGTLPGEFKAALLPICISGMLGVLFALTALIVQRPSLTFILLALGSVVLVISLHTFGFPLLEPWRTSRAPARSVAAARHADDRVALWGSRHAGFAFYLNRVPEPVESDAELLAMLQRAGRLFCLLPAEQYEKLKVEHPQLPAYLFMRSGNLAVVTNRLPGE